ncbi:MAG: response regulator [Betaproteobacteria bacterium]|nr:response regulator [Betaproteobacteria bacterium]
MHSHTTGLLALLIIVSALLIGHRAGLWASAVVILTVIVMFVFEWNRWSIDPDAARNLKPLNILITYCILFSATGAMLFLFSKALHEALHAASEQEQHLRQLIELAPFGYVMHRDERVLMVNRVAAAARGFEAPERMVGMSIYDLLPAEHREFASGRVAAAKSGAQDVDSSAEYRLKDKRGRERRVEALTMSLALSDGPALLTVMRDVTREREATATLAIAKEQAEAANRTKSQFLASMSHEIRTPLNGVLGMADLLQGTTLDDEQRRYCDAIKASGHALRELIGNILDLAKIEAGKVELEREDFELSRLLDDLVTAYRELARARGNTFQTSFDLPPYVRLNGDSLRLRQVLTNLLGNAIKFTENGWIELGARALEARPGDARRWVRFIVRDAGVGMTNETISKLFQPFSQADSSTTRQFGGTGLGLTIVKHLVDLMGGTVEVESAPGAGSEFRVELPFELARSSADAMPPEVLTVVPATGTSLQILLVEDNEINQEVARAMLQKAGHRVEVAGDGAEAVLKCTRGHFDCVLMDCQMPVMDGFEATRSIRAREAASSTARTHIVALTANAMAGDRERCLGAGMDDFLAKPFNTASLLATVMRSTARHGAVAVPESAPAEVPISFDPAFVRTTGVDGPRDAGVPGQAYEPVSR